MSVEKKKLGLFDTICLAFASFFSIELVSSQASLGPSMVFCILTIALVYLICHALVCAELGSTYPDQGGVYVWVAKAFGPRWAARTTWWYWVNAIAFIPCTLVSLIIVFQQIFELEISNTLFVILGIIGTWVISGLNCFSLRDTKLLSNAGSILKFIVCVALIVGGAIYGFNNGFANEFSAETIIPSFDLGLLGLIPVYIYGLTGMDLISCNAGEMEDPKHDVPRSLAIAGTVSILVYLLSAVAVLWVIPVEGIDISSGMIDAIIIIFNGSHIVTVLLGLSLVVVYVSYIFSWAIGANAVAQEAAESGELPKVFAITNSQHAPVGPAMLLGAAATVLMIVYGATASDGSVLFWTLLAFTSIVFFFPYFIISFALIKLRRDDPDAERPFAIPGKVLPSVIALLHAALVLIGIIGYTLPPEGEDPVMYPVTIVVGIVLSQIVGEILISRAAKDGQEAE